MKDSNDDGGRSKNKGPTKLNSKQVGSSRKKEKAGKGKRERFDDDSIIFRYRVRGDLKVNVNRSNQNAILTEETGERREQQIDVDAVHSSEYETDESIHAAVIKQRELQPDN